MRCGGSRGYADPGDSSGKFIGGERGRGRLGSDWGMSGAALADAARAMAAEGDVAPAAACFEDYDTGATDGDGHLYGPCAAAEEQLSRNCSVAVLLESSSGSVAMHWADGYSAACPSALALNLAKLDRYGLIASGHLVCVVQPVGASAHMRLLLCNASSADPADRFSAMHLNAAL